MQIQPLYVLLSVAYMLAPLKYRITVTENLLRQNKGFKFGIIAVMKQRCQKARSLCSRRLNTWYWLLEQIVTPSHVCIFFLSWSRLCMIGLIWQLVRMSSEPASIESLRVLYQSDDYIIVDKHWDIRIDSKMWYEKQTVQLQLQHHFPHLADPSTYYGFR